MKTQTVIGIVVAVALAVIILVMSANNKSTQSNEELKTVRVGYLPGLISMAHVVAQHQGFYTEHGIRPEPVEFQSSNQLYDALATGQVDVAAEFSALPVLINHLKDPGKVQIFTTSKYSSVDPFDEIVVPGDSPIRELSELAGKKIGVFPGSTATAFLREYLNQHQVDTSKIEFVQLPPPQQLEAFEAGSIDALYGYEPNPTYAVTQMGARVIGEPVFSSFIENSPVGVGVVNSVFAREHPQLAGQVVAVFDETFDYFVSNEDETRAILVSDMQLPPAVADKVTLIYQTRLNDDDKALFDQFTDILVRLKELPSKPDLSTIYYR